MKKGIERVFIVVILFFALMLTFKAEDKEECDVHKKYELGTHASQVTYDVTFVESTKTFNLTILNLNSQLALTYEEKVYKPSSKGVVIKGIKEGSKAILEVSPQEFTGCDTQTTLRLITYQAPYYNPFLKSEECLNYPELSVCQTKFYGYELSYDLFNQMLTSQRYEMYGEEEPEPEPIVDDKWKEFIMSILYKYGMQTTLFILGSGSVIVLGQSAIKRAKAKF